MLVLTTLDARERRLLRGRRTKPVTDAPAAAVPTSRATVVAPEALADRAHAERWLEDVRGGDEVARSELERALAVINRALHAHRLAHADPSARDVAVAQALVVRVGFGGGEAVAEGHYEQALELPAQSPGRRRRSMAAPEERFAALLGGRERPLACEELVLRASADIRAGRSREAALQARVALEALLAELSEELPAHRRAALEADRGPVGEAANAALREAPTPALAEALGASLQRMEAALRARTVG